MLSPSILQAGGPLPASFDQTVARLVLAAALGLFLGLEREWSEKSAGIRTFSLTSLVGAVFTVLAREEYLGEALLAIGGVLVIVQGVLLAVQSLQEGAEEGLLLTTSVSLLVAYGVGALVASGYILAGVTVAVVSSLLLVLKRELHGFAGALSREELRSSTEFAILAFVVYPLLPPGEIDVYGVPLEPRVAWLMVVTVAGIGIINYAVVRSYGGRGIAVTGFFGGLASSTAVVGTMLDHVKQHPEAATYGVAGVLLANAAMAVRNLAIVLLFTLNSSGPVLTTAVVPLGVIVVGSVAVAAVVADWGETVEMDLESPFSLQNALSFGFVFLLILATGALAQAEFGSAGLLVSAFVSGLVSSAGATTSAVLLYRSGTIGGSDAVVAVLLATASSIVVKAALSATGPKRFARRVAVWSVVVLAVSGVTTLIVAMLG
ncbi:MgtC/SapB family protein [Haloprofundus halobius]|uniref:MgtC/SapB family protein n=1 Tax=Haloprofundus halobius TaxID=2876194 RepID=UPI001CD03FD7|nr:MgtC/SapB family protein [Haloprofundus halobius]